MRIFKLSILTFLFTLSLSGLSMLMNGHLTNVARAQLDTICSQDEFKNSDVCAQKAADPTGDKVGGSNGLFTKIINIVIYLTASISVVMVVLGAFKYVTSQGEASATKSAKDTILYALIGLFVSISAFVIVRFVIAKI